MTLGTGVFLASLVFAFAPLVYIACFNLDIEVNYNKNKNDPKNYYNDGRD